MILNISQGYYKMILSRVQRQYTLILTEFLKNQREKTNLFNTKNYKNKMA